MFPFLGHRLGMPVHLRGFGGIAIHRLDQRCGRWVQTVQRAQCQRRAIEERSYGKLFNSRVKEVEEARRLFGWLKPNASVRSETLMCELL